MKPLHELGAAEAVDLLSRRAISAEELARACLDRIAEREPVVQAWEALDADAALAQARRIDAAREQTLLRGLPVGIKDIIDTADLPTSYGSPIHRGHRPGADAECVAALRASGAVILGKTVTTEFAVYSPGKTRNPRDPARTPGGSSSGSAAAVTDSMVPAALGSQTAGSVIRPASFCGVVGWKPTFGKLPLGGVHPLAPSLDTLGFFVRALEDVPLVAAAIRSDGRVRPIAERERGPRLGLCRTDQWLRAEPQTRRLVEGAAESLRCAGAEVREVILGPAFDGLAEAQIALMGSEAAVSLRGKDRGRMSDKLRGFLDEGASQPAERLRAAREQAERCKREIARIFTSVDALITPAAAGEAPAGLSSTGDPAFCRIWTLLGVPCVSLPVLRGPAGLPVGLQVVGAFDEDDRLLEAASWILTRIGSSGTARATPT